MNNREFAQLLVTRIEEHKHKLCDGKSGPVNAAYFQAHEHIIELINVLTPSEVEEPPVRNAHWITVKTDESHYNYICNHCYGKSKFRKSKFCPDCGYLMTKEKNNEES